MNIKSAATKHWETTVAGIVAALGGGMKLLLCLYIRFEIFSTFFRWLGSAGLADWTLLAESLMALGVLLIGLFAAVGDFDRTKP